MTDHYPRGLVLFDCDGTLSDSHHAIVAAMQDAFRSRGFPVPEEASVTPLIGLSLSVVLQHLLSSMNQAFTTDDLARLSNAYRQHYHRHEKQVALFPGVREGLMTLHQQGWWLGIVTGKSRAGLDHLLAHFPLNDYFLTTHTADECRSRPHSEMVEQALAATDMSTQQCQMEEIPLRYEDGR